MRVVSRRAFPRSACWRTLHHNPTTSYRGPWSQYTPWMSHSLDSFPLSKQRFSSWPEEEPKEGEDKLPDMILTEKTPNMDCMKFLPGRAVFKTATIDFPDARAGLASPLATALFRVEGIKRVFFGPDFITVNKDEGYDWLTLRAQIFGAIMEFYASGVPIMKDKTKDVSPNTIKEEDSEVVKMIKELLDTRIRPTVQEDGGDINFKTFDPDKGIVYLQMHGSCSGCPSSSVTLKQGIERMLKHWIEEVKEVVAVEDEPLKEANDTEFKKFEEKLATQ